MPTMTVSEARASMPEIIERVLTGEEVTLTRHGVAVAVVVRPDALKVRRADEALLTAAKVRDVLERGRASSLDAPPTMTEERADELVEDMRASRSKR